MLHCRYKSRFAHDLFAKTGHDFGQKIREENEGGSLPSVHSSAGISVEPEEKNQTEGFFSFQESKSIVALYF